MIVSLFKQTSSAAPVAGIQGGGLAACGLTALWCMLQDTPFHTRISHRVFAPGPHKETGVFWPYKDLGDTLLLPTDLACFLGDASDEWIDTPHPPTPLGHKFPDATQWWG